MSETDTTTKLLLYAKDFCLRAERDANQGGRISPMLAALHIHDAIEFCLNAIVQKENISVNPIENFGGLRKKINGHFESQKMVLPKPSQIDFLNTARNNVKHHASLPSDDDVNRCLADGRAFLEEVFLQYFHLSFLTFSMTDLVKPDRIRKDLQNAANFLEQKKEEEALISISKAFYLADPYQQPNIALLLGGQQFQQKDMRQYQRLTYNLYTIVPILDEEDNDPASPRINPRRYRVISSGYEKTSSQDVGETLYTAVEMILDWQYIGMFNEHPKNTQEANWSVVRRVTLD